MKKILLIGILSIMISSCKKQATEPVVQNNVQQPVLTSCQQYGACAEGWYKVMPITNTSVDTIVYTTGTTQLGHARLEFIKYQHHPGTMSNSGDSLLYVFTNFDFNTNVLTNDTIYTHLYGSLNQGPINYYGVNTKSHKTIVLNFDHY
jgi:hypothetical protein